MNTEDLIELLNSLPSDAIATGSITIASPGRADITIALRDPIIALEQADPHPSNGKAGE